MDINKLIDVGCGKLIPQGNMDSSKPGTLGYMMKSLGDAYKSNRNFYSSAPGGFTPGSTTKGIDGNWGMMTNSNN